MKNQKINICCECGFKTNIYQKKCPICHKEMIQSEQDKIEDLKTMPEIINYNEKDIKITYYCHKCHKDVVHKACLECNNITALTLIYNNKRAIIRNIESLYDVFEDDEVAYISKNLSQEQKEWLYHTFDNSYYFFYKKDNLKCIAYLIVAVLIYCLILNITFYENEQEFLYACYVTNALGNFFLLYFSIIGFWYLKDAAAIELRKESNKIAVNIAIPLLMHIFMCIGLAVSLRFMLISGFIFMIIAVLLYLGLYYLRVKHEK